MNRLSRSANCKSADDAVTAAVAEVLDAMVSTMAYKGANLMDVRCLIFLVSDRLETTTPRLKTRERYFASFFEVEG